MSAIEHCRAAALAGHVMRCENDACGYTAIAYNSCRDRHCPKCQGAAALEKLLAAHAAGRLTFHGAHAALVDTKAFAAYLAPLKKRRWYVYTQRPPELLSKGAGPEAVLAYLSRYTHRVAISNRRLIAVDAKTVTFTVKDYRINGPGRYKTMTLDTHEFIRRFLIQVLPTGFHRIRQGRSRQRSFEPISRNAQSGLEPLLPGFPSLIASTARLRDHAARRVITGRSRNDPDQIPIEPAAALRPISRGFLP